MHSYVLEDTIKPIPANIKVMELLRNILHSY